MSKSLLRISSRRSSSKGWARGFSLAPRAAAAATALTLHLLPQVGVPKQQSRTACGTN